MLIADYGSLHSARSDDDWTLTTRSAPNRPMYVSIIFPPIYIFVVLTKEPLSNSGELLLFVKVIRRWTYAGVIFFSHQRVA